MHTAFIIFLATSAIAAEQALYPERDRLASLRTQAMVQANTCERSLCDPDPKMQACEDWKNTFADYLDQIAHQYRWCAKQIEAAPTAPVPLDCPVGGLMSDDPIIRRYNSLGPRIGLPRAE